MTIHGKGPAMHDSPEINPYASPTYTDDSPVIGAVNPLTSIAQQGTLRSFRTVMHTVGGIWIAFAVLIFVGTLALAGVPADGLLLGIMFGMGIMWLVLGLATCFKHMWAVYVGLVLCYLSALGNVLQLNFCALVIVVPIIILAHVAISKASQLRRAGIPYNAKPGLLATAGRDPFDNPSFDFLDQEK